MQDISLHLLDIAENSIRAEASFISITINESIYDDLLSLIIEDNGEGMEPSFVAKATDPFVTTRTTRKIGLGLVLLKQNCLQAGGLLKINSKKGKGTKITATMAYTNINRLVLGDIVSSLCLLIQSFPNIHLVYTHKYNDKQFIFDTNDVKKTLKNVPINNLEVLEGIRQFIDEKINEIRVN